MVGSGSEAFLRNATKKPDMKRTWKEAAGRFGYLNSQTKSCNVGSQVKCKNPITFDSCSGKENNQIAQKTTCLNKEDYSSAIPRTAGADLS